MPQFPRAQTGDQEGLWGGGSSLIHEHLCSPSRLLGKATRVVNYSPPPRAWFLLRGWGHSGVIGEGSLGAMPSWDGGQQSLMGANGGRVSGTLYLLPSLEHRPEKLWHPGSCRAGEGAVGLGAPSSRISRVHRALPCGRRASERVAGEFAMRRGARSGRAGLGKLVRARRLPRGKLGSAGGQKVCLSPPPLLPGLD